MERILRRFDLNGDRHLNMNELSAAFSQTGTSVTRRQLQQVLDSFAVRGRCNLDVLMEIFASRIPVLETSGRRKEHRTVYTGRLILPGIPLTLSCQPDTCLRGSWMVAMTAMLDCRCRFPCKPKEPSNTDR